MFELFVLGQVLLMLDSNKVQRVDAGWEITAPQYSFIVGEDRRMVRGERSRLEALVVVQMHIHHMHPG
jgi:hypothetical protein